LTAIQKKSGIQKTARIRQLGPYYFLILNPPLELAFKVGTGFLCPELVEGSLYLLSGTPRQDGGQECPPYFETAVGVHGSDALLQNQELMEF